MTTSYAAQDSLNHMPKILLIDDDSALLDALSLAFEDAGHDVVVVRYEGCHLTVLECSDNAVRGKLGA